MRGNHVVREWGWGGRRGHCRRWNSTAVANTKQAEPPAHRRHHHREKSLRHWFALISCLVGGRSFLVSSSTCCFCISCRNGQYAWTCGAPAWRLLTASILFANELHRARDGIHRLFHCESGQQRGEVGSLSRHDARARHLQPRGAPQRSPRMLRAASVGDGADEGLCAVALENSNAIQFIHHVALQMALRPPWCRPSL